VACGLAVLVCRAGPPVGTAGQLGTGGGAAAVVDDGDAGTVGATSGWAAMPRRRGLGAAALVEALIEAWAVGVVARAEVVGGADPASGVGAGTRGITTEEPTSADGVPGAAEGTRAAPLDALVEALTSGVGVGLGVRTGSAGAGD